MPVASSARSRAAATSGISMRGSVANASVTKSPYKPDPVLGGVWMFRGRHYDRSIILLCVRWYLAYGLSLRDLEEMMAERGISVDHATIHRWVIRYSPELLRRC